MISVSPAHRPINVPSLPVDAEACCSVDSFARGLGTPRAEVILEALVRALEQEPAAELGMSRRNLYRKLARYGIEGGS